MTNNIFKRLETLQWEVKAVINLLDGFPDACQDDLTKACIKQLKLALKDADLGAIIMEGAKAQTEPVKSVSADVGAIINRMIESRPDSFTVTLPDGTKIEYLNMDISPVATPDSTEERGCGWLQSNVPVSVIHALSEALRTTRAAAVYVQEVDYSAEITNLSDPHNVVMAFDTNGMLIREQSSQSRFVIHYNIGVVGLKIVRAAS